MYIDELIEQRLNFRINKNYSESDKIRNYLEENNIFIIDLKDNQQEVYYLPETFFRDKTISKKQYFENWNKKNIQAEKLFDSWLYIQKSKKPR